MMGLTNQSHNIRPRCIKPRTIRIKRLSTHQSHISLLQEIHHRRIRKERDQMTTVQTGLQERFTPINDPTLRNIDMMLHFTIRQLRKDFIHCTGIIINKDISILDLEKLLNKDLVK